MVFRFYINSTLVDEPVGFDATKIKLKRSENYHGIMAESDNQTVEIYGNGYTILKTLYDADGIDAVATMLIQYKCESEYVDLGEYSITFYNSEWYCGEDCYCKIGLERKGCLYKLTNAIDTKVDMDSTKCIDGSTDMALYEWMGKEIDVPSKSILLKNTGILTEDIRQDMFTDITNTFSISGFIYDLNLFIPTEIVYSEMETFEPLPLSDWWVTSAGGDAGTLQYIFTNNFADKCSSNVNFNLFGKLKFQFKAELDDLVDDSILSFRVWKQKTDSTLSTIYSQIIPLTTVGITDTADADIDYDLNITLESGESLLMSVRYGFAATSGTDIYEMWVNFDKATTINITTLSICDSTPAKVYLVNEALSHTAEYVTNNCLRVYSEFLGRTDSQPYNMFADGCGGMLALTYGLFLRRIEKVKATNAKPIFSLSFQDIINAIDSIYGIGFTIEQRGGIDVLRVENWEYFYNDNVITDIGNVTVKKKPDLNLHIKNFKTGYSRYEAEEYNGLDEFLTEREYSTKLINHNKTLEKVCKFIASGYAIEITRRKGNDNTKDWRFDNDTFILCVERGGSYGYTDYDISVEQANIINDANILDAPTVLNFRISPARMAMRWFKYLTTFIKDVKELVFTSGKGNIAAEGELVSGCKIDSGVISEKQNLLETDFLYSQIPLFSAELHEVNDVPFTHEQYKLVKANPEGLIAYSCDGVQSYGWIKEIEYSFVDGSADFILIPKY